MTVFVYCHGGQCCLDKGESLPQNIVGNNALALHQLKVDLTVGARRTITACLEDLWDIYKNVMGAYSCKMLFVFSVRETGQCKQKEC